MRFEFEIELRPVRKIREKKSRKPSLRKNLVLAYQIQDLLEQGKARTLEQVSGWLGFNRARISQIMNLLFLAPEIQTEILLSENLNIPECQARNIPIEPDWINQKRIWLNLPNRLSV